MKAPPESALASKAASKAKKARRAPAKSLAEGPESGFRRFSTPNGFSVLIGRNNRQNDLLSLKVAKGDDLWFHARGVPGAHVVLKAQSGRDPEHEDVLCAANLAAWFSKAKNDSKVNVTQTTGAHVSKPKGAPPGLVSVSKETVVVAKPHRSMAVQSQDLRK
ncbi:unnamed protein product [Ostreobium quekettii]|uniref:NFACT RNA-binding domain-containing protein n=1 Tax=Ostreobium quekettii TaxID=121088 RepID=A0A8S1J726_9CHLO|nr:unnamed protein product [Ostreobium quekettii]|eukprot:evm.model.scf_1599.3 EVM.evm.TU.scf_1599.3   scf_1599:14900-15877(+)